MGEVIDTGTRKAPDDAAFTSGPNRKLAKSTKGLRSKTIKHDNTDFIIQIGEVGSEIHLPKNRQDLGSFMMPKFIGNLIQSNDLIEHAIELWRIEQRLDKIALVDESQRELFKSSIQKLKRYLDKNDIEIIDHTDQKFSEGRNLDVLLVEKSSDVKESTIKETKEPTILYKNQVVHKGKVIVQKGNNGGVQHG